MAPPTSTRGEPRPRANIRCSSSSRSPMLRAILLGTGSPPPNPRRHGSATLLSLDGECFLVDAGSCVMVQLGQVSRRAYDWARVFITHHHSDHRIDLGHF